MDVRVDFLAQDLLGTLDGQTCHLFAQRFTRFHDLLVGFLAGSSWETVASRVGAGAAVAVAAVVLAVLVLRRVRRSRGARPATPD